MPLIKFCKAEHNIRLGAKLQIGTLFGYRNIENQEIRDDAEGKYDFTIEFPEEIELDHRWANLLLAPGMLFGSKREIPRFNGSFDAHVETMNVVRSLRDSVVLERTKIHINRSVNNCFAFCMSLSEAAEKSPFKQYTDYWVIPDGRVEEFARQLGNLIFQQAKLSYFDSSLTERHSPLTARSLSIGVMHRKVIYRDRHMRITRENKPSYEELVDLLSNVQFLKPPGFSKENEYRFVFELNDGQIVFPAKERNLLLNLNPLADFIVAKPAAK
jgi:hypothetical protein